MLPPLTHQDLEEHDDEAKAREARAHLGRRPELQLVAELLGKLRATELPWWTPQQLREAWPARARMRWLKDRPDLRQRVTSKLTGFAPNAARKFWPDDQAELIDAVLDSGDVAAVDFEAAFDPCDLAVYGPAAELWRRFRAELPWEEDSPAHQRLAAWLLRALITDRSGIDGMTRRPLLTAWEVRAAIDPTAWQRHVPIEIRAAIDETRLRHEKARPREPFHVRHELAVATPERIAQALPLVELTAVLAHAERSMGFGGDDARAEDVDSTSEPPASSSEPRPSQIN